MTKMKIAAFLAGVYFLILSGVMYLLHEITEEADFDIYE